MKKLLKALSLVSMAVFATFSSKINSSIEVNAAEEIQDKGDRITWVDASVQLPYNYPSIIGFTLNFTLVTDRTNYTDGYGGITEDKTSPYYNMRFPCYMLVVSKGASDNTLFNKDTFYAAEGENFEHYVNQDLLKKEIVKIGCGEGHYVATYLDNGKSWQETQNMVAGDSATITYKGTAALFEQGDPYLTFYGYTAEFKINSIEWITGTPAVTEEVEWDIVEHETFNDIATVEKAEDQNGCNYVNIIKPKNAAEKCPVVLWIHGGAWSTSSRTDIILNNTMEYFLSKGYAFVSAEYTLTDSSAALTMSELQKVAACKDLTQRNNLLAVYKYKNATQGKQMMYDLKLAVRFLRANGDTYGLDTSYICAMGESAGAHLATLMSTTNDKEEYEGADGSKYGGWSEYSSDVQCAVGYSTPTDISMDSATYLQDYKADYPLLESTVTPEYIAYSNFTMAYILLGYSYLEDHIVSGTLGAADAVYDDECMEAMKYLSPYWQVNSDTPPMYLIHGEADNAVVISHAYALELQAKTYMDENDVKTAYYPEAGHVDKNYFDKYGQYNSTYEFVEAARQDYLEELSKEKAEEKKDDDSSKTSEEGTSSSDTKSSKGCKGDVASSAFLFIAAGAGIIALKKRKSIRK